MRKGNARREDIEEREDGRVNKRKENAYHVWSCRIKKRNMCSFPQFSLYSVKMRAV